MIVLTAPGKEREDVVVFLRQHRTALLSIAFFFIAILCQAQQVGVPLNFIETVQSSDQLGDTSLYFVVKAEKSLVSEGLRHKSIAFAKEFSQGYHVVRFSSFHRNQGIVILGRANDRWKISQQLQKQDKEAGKRYLITTSDLHRFKSFLNDRVIRHKILDEHRVSQTMIVELADLHDLDIIITSPYITFIDVFSGEAEEESPNYSQDVSVNGVNFVHHHNPLINGNGFTVSIKERTPDRTDIDLKGRLLDSPLKDAEISAHANQIATIISGGGNNAPSSKGVAWASHIFPSSFSRLLPDAANVFNDYGITVQNHSYGVGIDNKYGAEARAYDIAANENTSLIHVFSSGNVGTETDDQGPYVSVPGYANLSGNMKMAKNVLVVGAHDKVNEIDLRSSRGPAFDGRVKPELIAFGPEGTSDAAAMVSGISLLVQQAYKNAVGQLPSSALLKGILISAADDAGEQGIDFISGYGSVNAIKAIQLVQRGQFFNSTIQANEQKQFTIIIPPETKLLRLTLTWNDPAANAGVATALVNDLDMRLNSPSGESWLPWVVSHYANPDSLAALPKRKSDHRNNVEFITIENPAPGAYQCNVKGFSLATQSQSFHISYWLDRANTFQWTFPTGSDHLESGQEVYFRWENSFENTGTLEISLNEGPFLELANSIDLSKRFFTWIAPDTTVNAVARMKIGNDYFLSDVFTISPSMAINIGFNCDENLMLTWNKVSTANQYHLLALGDHYLEKISETSDTVLFLSKTDVPSDFLAIAPMIGSTTGLVGTTYNYTTQGVNCYYRNFYATLEPGPSASLSLNLSTNYNVDRIIFEKLTRGTFTSLQEQKAGNGFTYEYADNLFKGDIYEYRASIFLKSGEKIVTDTARLYYADAQTVFLYPNPVSSANDLTVISDGTDLTIAFYDTQGRVIKTQELAGAFFTVPISGLTTGFYVYRIFRNSLPVFSGRLVVN